MSNDQPFASAFVAHWFSDPGVLLLGAEARLLWLELIGRCCQFGRTEISDTPARLAALVRTNIRELERGLSALADAGCADVEWSADGKTVRVRPVTGMEGAPDVPKAPEAPVPAPVARVDAPPGVEYPTTPEEVLAAAESVFYIMSRWEAEKFLAENSAMEWKIRGTQVRNWKKLLLKWKEMQTPEQRKAAIAERSGEQVKTEPEKQEKQETTDSDELAVYLRNEAEAQKHHVARTPFDLAKK